MKTKFKNIIKIVAAGLFLAALVMNVKVSLDDEPFSLSIASDNVLANMTEPGGTSNTGPGSVGTCGGIFTGHVRYICLNTNPYPCTEKHCS